MTAPGRSCPTHYRYSPRVLAGHAKLSVETLYIVGGLYGNRSALAAVGELWASEPGEAKIIFNGDFNWFNIDDDSFGAINTAVFDHTALRGNVETELAHPDAQAGCGCAYPAWVSDAQVRRSNQIMARLRKTARRFPELCERLAALPMHLVVDLGGVRVGIVHGDAESLAGWGFSHIALADPRQRRRVQDLFAETGVNIFASSHTCLPVVQSFEVGGAQRVVVNNGAAGMPNFFNARFGLITRISIRPVAHVSPIYGHCLDGVYVEALPVYYDDAAWQRAFVANWSAGSPAYESYFQRINQGPDYNLALALRGAPGWSRGTSHPAHDRFQHTAPSRLFAGPLLEG
jgi:hypothetical protein